MAGLVRTNDQVMQRIALFLSAPEAVNFRSSCKAVHTVLDEIYWQNAVNSWAPSWLVEQLKRYYKLPTWKAAARVIAMFLSCIHTWRRIVQGGLPTADDARTYIPATDPNEASVAAAASGTDANTNSAAVVVPAAAAGAANPVAYPAAPQPAAAAGVAGTVAGRCATKIHWVVQQLLLMNIALRNKAENANEELLQKLALQLGIFYCMVLRRVLVLRRFQSDVEGGLGAAEDPKRTPTKISRECGGTVGSAFSFFRDLLAGHGALRFKGSVSRGQSMGPVLGILLPCMLRNIFRMMRHTHPHTHDPMRDQGFGLVESARKYFPIPAISDDSENYCWIVDSALRHAVTTGQASELDVFLSTASVSHGSVKLNSPNYKAFRRRTLQTVARYVVRTTRHVLWQVLMAELGINTRDAAAQNQLSGSGSSSNASSAGILTDPEAVHAFISNRLSSMPLDRAEAIVVTMCMCLKQEGGDPFSGHRAAARLNRQIQNDEAEAAAADEFEDEEDDGQGEDDGDDDDNDDEEEADNENDGDGGAHHAAGDGSDDSGSDDSGVWSAAAHSADYYFGDTDDEDADDDDDDAPPANSAGAGRNSGAKARKGANGSAIGNGQSAGGLSSATGAGQLSGADAVGSLTPLHRKQAQRRVRDALQSAATAHALSLMTPISEQEIDASDDPFGVTAAWVAQANVRLRTFASGSELPASNVRALVSPGPASTTLDAKADVSRSSTSAQAVHSYTPVERQHDLMLALYPDADHLHKFLLSEDWGCGLPCDEPSTWLHTDADGATGSTGDDDSATRREGRTATYHVAAIARLQFYAAISACRWACEQPLFKNATPAQLLIMDESIRTSIARAQAMIDANPAEEADGNYPLAMQPYITRAIWESDLLPRTAAWSLQSTVTLLMAGMQAYGRGYIRGLIPLHPALSNPMLSDRESVRIHGFHVSWCSLGRDDDEDGGVDVNARTSNKPDESRDAGGAIPPKWMAITPAAVAPTGVDAASASIASTAPAAINVGPASAVCRLLAAYLSLLSPDATPEIIHKFCQAIGAIADPDFTSSFSDAGPLWVLSDLFPRLIAMMKLPMLQSASRLQTEITDLLVSVMTARPQMLAVSASARDLYFSMTEAMKTRVSHALSSSPEMAVLMKMDADGLDDLLREYAKNAPALPPPVMAPAHNDNNDAGDNGGAGAGRGGAAGDNNGDGAPQAAARQLGRHEQAQQNELAALVSSFERLDPASALTSPPATSAAAPEPLPLAAVANGRRAPDPPALYLPLLQHSNNLYCIIASMDVVIGGINQCLDLVLMAQESAIIDAQLRIPRENQGADSNIDIETRMKTQYKQLQKGMREVTDKVYAVIGGGDTGGNAPAQVCVARSSLAVESSGSSFPLSRLHPAVGYDGADCLAVTRASSNGVVDDDTLIRYGPAGGSSAASAAPASSAAPVASATVMQNAHPVLTSSQIRSDLLRWTNEIELLLFRLQEGFFALLMAEWHNDVGGRPDDTINRLVGHAAATVLGGRRGRNFIWKVKWPEGRDPGPLPLPPSGRDDDDDDGGGDGDAHGEGRIRDGGRRGRRGANDDIDDDGDGSGSEDLGSEDEDEEDDVYDMERWYRFPAEAKASSTRAKATSARSSNAAGAPSTAAASAASSSLDSYIASWQRLRSIITPLVRIGIATEQRFNMLRDEHEDRRVAGQPGDGGDAAAVAGGAAAIMQLLAPDNQEDGAGGNAAAGAAGGLVQHLRAALAAVPNNPNNGNNANAAAQLQALDDAMNNMDLGLPVEPEARRRAEERLADVQATYLVFERAFSESLARRDIQHAREALSRLIPLQRQLGTILPAMQPLVQTSIENMKKAVKDLEDAQMAEVDISGDGAGGPSNAAGVGAGASSASCAAGSIPEVSISVRSNAEAKAAPPDLRGLVEDEDTDPLSAMDQFSQVGNLLSRICTIRSMLTGYVDRRGGGAASDGGDGGASASSSASTRLSIDGADVPDDTHVPLLSAAVARLSPPTAALPSGSANGVTPSEHQRGVIWGRILAMVTSLALLTDIAANPRLEEDEEEHLGSMDVEDDHDDDDDDDDVDDTEQALEEEYGDGSDDDDGHNDGDADDDDDDEAPSAARKGGRGLATAKATGSGNNNGARAGGGGGANGFRGFRFGLNRGRGHHNDDDDDEEEDDGNSSDNDEDDDDDEHGDDDDDDGQGNDLNLDDWYHDFLIHDFVPSAASSLFEVIGVFLRDLPVSVARQAIAHIGLPTLVRTVLIRVNGRCTNPCLHNYFFLAGEAMTGRIPELTAAVTHQLLSNSLMRNQWLMFMKHVLIRIPPEHTASTVQVCLTLVRILNAMCVKDSHNAVIAEFEPQSLAGYAPRLVPIGDQQSASQAPKRARASASAAAAASAGAAPSATSSSASQYPRPLDDLNDMSVPDCLMAPPSRSWIEAGWNVRDDWAARLDKQNFADFIQKITASFADAKGSNTPFIEHLLSIVVAVLASPHVYKHIGQGELIAAEWRALTTGTARLIRVYHAEIDKRKALLPIAEAVFARHVKEVQQRHKGGDDDGDAEKDGWETRGMKNKKGGKKVGKKDTDAAAATRLPTSASAAAAAADGSSPPPFPTAAIAHQFVSRFGFLSIHTSGLWNAMYSAIVRTGGLGEALRCGWTNLTPPRSVESPPGSGCWIEVDAPASSSSSGAVPMLATTTTLESIGTEQWCITADSSALIDCMRAWPATGPHSFHASMGAVMQRFGVIGHQLRHRSGAAAIDITRLQIKLQQQHAKIASLCSVGSDVAVESAMVVLLRQQLQAAWQILYECVLADALNCRLLTEVSCPGTVGRASACLSYLMEQHVCVLSPESRLDDLMRHIDESSHEVDAEYIHFVNENANSLPAASGKGKVASWFSAQRNSNFISTATAKLLCSGSGGAEAWKNLYSTDLNAWSRAKLATQILDAIADGRADADVKAAKAGKGPSAGSGRTSDQPPEAPAPAADEIAVPASALLIDSISAIAASAALLSAHDSAEIACQEYEMGESERSVITAAVANLTHIITTTEDLVDIHNAVGGSKKNRPAAGGAEEKGAHNARMYVSNFMRAWISLHAFATTPQRHPFAASAVDGHAPSLPPSPSSAAAVAAAGLSSTAAVPGPIGAIGLPVPPLASASSSAASEPTATAEPTAASTAARVSHYPVLADTRSAAAHLFKLAVVEDCDRRGLVLDADDDDPEHRHEPDASEPKDLRSAAARVHDGRRWLATFFWLARMVESGFPVYSGNPSASN